VGHANLTNLSEFFQRRLYAKGKLSIEDAVHAARSAGETLNASEAAYEDKGMLAFGFNEIVRFLASHSCDCPCCDSQGPVIVPVELSEEERKQLHEWWEEGHGTDWEYDESDPECAFALVDRIKWKYGPGWRNKYPDLPVLANVTN
jgi:hypothetical protein